MPTREPFDTSTLNMDTPDNNTMITLTGLIPTTTYTVSLSAFTGAGEGNISSTATNMTLVNGNFGCIIVRYFHRIVEWLNNSCYVIIHAYLL